MKEEQVFQVLVEDRYGMPTLQNWYETKEEADSELADCKKFWPEDEFWIEEGTQYIHTKCKGCETVHAYERHDAYGITTGHWCDTCYDDSSKYHYRKDRYDYEGAGERLEEDY